LGNTGCFNPSIAPEDDPEDTPALSYGVAYITVTFATDEGDTKVYEVGDTVTVKVKIVVSDTRPWAVAEVTKTYNVIA
jgi:hypothetical protein